MIKGNERRVIVIEKVDSPYFEKAVFYVRHGARRHMSSKTLAAYANDLLQAYQREPAPTPVVTVNGGTITVQKAAPVQAAPRRLKRLALHKPAVIAGGAAAVGGVVCLLLFFFL